MMLQSMDLINFVNGSIEYSGQLTEVIQESATTLHDAEQSVVFGKPAFDVQAVKQAHLQWLGKLEQVIRGRARLRPDEVASGHECAFGRWYDNDGMEQFGDLPLYKELGQAHMQVHETAREIVRLVSKAQTGEAQKHMAGFNKLRKNLFQLLDRLYVIDTNGEERELVPWSDTLKVGIAQFDEDHKVLVRLINKLYAGMTTGKGRNTLGSILDELIAYTAEHFKREETLFKQHGYPDAAAHKAKHDKLVAKVLAFQRAFREEGEHITFELMNSLRDWLVRHIMGTDREYTAFFNDKGIN
jgi:hemerythrin-like metal-binding protein